MKSAQKKYLALFLFFLLILIAGLSIYWLMWWRDPPTGDYYHLNYLPEQDQPVDYQKIGREPTDPTIGDINPEKSDPTLTHVLKGYFHSLDLENNRIELKYRFAKSLYLEVLEVDLSSLSNFYCWPEKVESEGVEYYTKDLDYFIHPDKRDIGMANEKVIGVDLLPTFLDQDRFLIIQLYEAFDNRNNNQIQKLVLLGC